MLQSIFNDFFAKTTPKLSVPDSPFQVYYSNNFIGSIKHLTMYDPDSYDAYSEFQRRDARELLPYIATQMDWRRPGKILDFGCGSGYNTRHVILPTLEKISYNNNRRDENNNGNHIYAIDISKKMVDFASVKYENPNITYMVADVSKEDCEFPCKFDKIFSLHVLHWILDQGKALRHLFDLLETNGEIGLYFIAQGAVFSVYDKMSKMPQWGKFLADAKNFIPKSHFSSDPAKDMSELMNSVGFTIQECRTFTKNFSFTSLENMIETAVAANPFFHRIPTELKDEYKSDFRNAFLPYVKYVPTKEFPHGVNVEYEILIVRGLKRMEK